MSGLDDLQADLDALAADLNNIAHGDFDEACPFCDIADRLRNLLTDRDLDPAPLTSEIIAWLEDDDPDHFAKVWHSGVNEWVEVIAPKVGVWRERLAKHGDQRQHGYRLGVREPATERVRLDQLPGRTLPGHVCPVNHFRWVYGDQRFEWTIHGGTWQPFDIAPDGTVEVLKDGGE